MLPACHRGDGDAIATPDTCLTPTGSGASVPTPYTNTAQNASATDYAENVMIAMMNALNLATTIPESSGDEEGTDSTIEGEVQFTEGSEIVYIEGSPAVTLTSPTEQNDGNAVGAVEVPSSSNVLFCHLAEPPAEAPGGDRYRRRLSRDDLDTLRGAPRAGDPISATLLEGDVGHVRVRLLSPDAPSRIQATLLSLSAGGMRSLILDLRGCPGGDLDAAVDVAGSFLPCGVTVARVVDGDGDVLTLLSRTPTPQAWPLVVLVDARTASAAELVAGALQARDRAVVVGQRTYGKGAMQAVHREQGDFVAATVARVTLPDGAQIERAGILPDLDIVSGDQGLSLEAARVVALSLSDVGSA